MLCCGHGCPDADTDAFEAASQAQLRLGREGRLPPPCETGGRHAPHLGVSTTSDPAGSLSTVSLSSIGRRGRAPMIDLRPPRPAVAGRSGGRRSGCWPGCWPGCSAGCWPGCPVSLEPCAREGVVSRGSPSPPSAGDGAGWLRNWSKLSIVPPGSRCGLPMSSAMLLLRRVSCRLRCHGCNRTEPVAHVRRPSNIESSTNTTSVLAATGRAFHRRWLPPPLPSQGVRDRGSSRPAWLECS